jgi:DNA-binding LytR/AlgR family response regulator
MDKIKILVVEDEIIIADNLCDVIEELGYEALEPALNYTEALEFIEEEKPDIAILDIQLGGKKTGIDLAKEIIKNHNFPYIFLTSNSDEATIKEVKALNPPAFLVKPFTKEELYASIEIVLHNFSEKNEIVNEENTSSKDSLFIKEKGVYKKIVLKDVLYLKSEHVYTELFLKNNSSQLIRTSLNTIINKLNSNFVRVHRSYVININFLDEINSTFVKINGVIIPIGSTYKDNLFNRLNLI